MSGHHSTPAPTPVRNPNVRPYPDDDPSLLNTGNGSTPYFDMRASKPRTQQRGGQYGDSAYAGSIPGIPSTGHTDPVKGLRYHNQEFIAPTAEHETKEESQQRQQRLVVGGYVLDYVGKHTPIDKKIRIVPLLPKIRIRGTKARVDPRINAATIERALGQLPPKKIREFDTLLAQAAMRRDATHTIYGGGIVGMLNDPGVDSATGDPRSFKRPATPDAVLDRVKIITPPKSKLEKKLTDLYTRSNQVASHLHKAKKLSAIHPTKKRAEEIHHAQDALDRIQNYQVNRIAFGKGRKLARFLNKHVVEYASKPYDQSPVIEQELSAESYIDEVFANINAAPNKQKAARAKKILPGVRAWVVEKQIDYRTERLRGDIDHASTQWHIAAQLNRGNPYTEKPDSQGDTVVPIDLIESGVRVTPKTKKEGERIVKGLKKAGNEREYVEYAKRPIKKVQKRRQKIATQQRKHVELSSARR